MQNKSHAEKVQALYTKDYVPVYAKLYRDFKGGPKYKHKQNIRRLSYLLKDNSKWLDAMCGQAWHFTQFPNIANKLGVDISPAQVEQAKILNPNADFLCGDILNIKLEKESFDIVTSFWAAYCYLRNHENIQQFCENIISWTKPGGSVYIETIHIKTLTNFAGSTYQKDLQKHGYNTTIIFPDDSGRWNYYDQAGMHEMLSPTKSFFKNIFADKFEELKIENESRGNPFTQFVACKKK